MKGRPSVAENSQYELWFNNQSLNAGKACVYQSTANVTANVQPNQLAWMVYGANPNTWIVFKWSLDYAFVWINQGPPESYQVAPAGLSTSNAITLSYNDFGFLFSGQTQGTQGKLSVKEDDTVPSINNTVVGIGMSRAGTFAAGAGPNQSLIFTPVSDAELSYAITFGAYTFQTGDVLDISMLNPSCLVQFPIGVNSMTAVLNSANTWEKVTPGKPANMFLDNVLVYEAGVGLVA